ncbi:hypothetical protein [Actinokineospora xionganensis]|uniref:Uncharacterized protein n=1 Tax=Actinokineospora xionganensis TaxID=2684470 RepID=A0ABR7LEH2_9PSEU|nr:hypothetical protein [Actinokineospora xionganensis]MBC6450893.1 hypothetical protein [Actinokineospora xionganensis]
MGGRVARLVVISALLLGGCSSPARAKTVVFTKVDLPAAPVVLAADGDALVIGVRRDGQATKPGLLRRAADGAVTEIPVRGVSPYGLLATWKSIDVDAGRIVAVGGERGGAHGNVRWSVWDGSASGVVEKPQGFSTFGGYGAGDLTAAVITPVGPALVGSWNSEQVGLDVATWTADGDTWTRRSSAGTALESTQAALGFPMAASALDQGVLVAGWQLADDRLTPVVWRSASGVVGWTKTALPDTGTTASAISLACQASTCAAAGQVDGKLAVWRFIDGTWTRLPGAPPIPVSDKDPLAAPVEIELRVVQVLSEDGQVKIARADGRDWTLLAAEGPTGTVTAATTVGDALFVLAGPDAEHQSLWRVDGAKITD